MVIKSSQFVHTPEEHDGLLITHLLALPKEQGTVFAIIRFLGKKDQARQRIAQAIEERLAGLEQTLSTTGNAPRRFEQFLQALNQDIAAIHSQERRIPLSDVHIVLGIQQGEQLYVSGIGNLHVLFMNRTAKQRYVIYELGDQLQEQEDTTWDKLFATVLDGELHFGDIFYIASRVSEREISLAELQDILVTLPPSGALKRISQHLHLQTAYAGICFQVNEPTTGGMPKKVNPLTSVEQLGRTKEETEQLLGEQEADVGKFITRITKPLLRALSAPGTTGSRSTLKRTLRLLIQAILLILTSLFKAGAWLVQALWNLLAHFPQVYDTLRRFVKNEPTPKQRIATWIERFNALSRPTKIASVSFLSILVITIFSLRLLHGYQSKQADQEAQMNIIGRIEEKQTEAQARLIYDDQEEARQLIEEAFALLETLPSSTDESIVKEVRSELQTALMQIQGIEPVRISTIASVLETQSSLISPLNLAGQLFALSQTDDLYEVSELTNTLISTDLTKGSVGTIQIASPESDTSFLFVDENKQLGRGSIQSGSLFPIVSGVNDLASVEDLTIYNEALYVLTADGDQIMKMRTRGDGYEAGTTWITSSTSSLNNAKAMTIDGDVYVLTADRILKYRSGREQTFTHDSINPPLSDPIDLWTTTESSSLYILDPGQQRIIVLGKDGTLITQYSAPELVDAVGMVVQEDQRRIIVATPSSILSFPTTHLLQ